MSDNGDQDINFHTSIDVGVTSNGVAIRFKNQEGHLVELAISRQGAEDLILGLRMAIDFIPQGEA